MLFFRQYRLLQLLRVVTTLTFLTFVAFLLLFGFRSLAIAESFLADDLRISQVYGGGGNSGAPYQCDFIEIFNAGTASISLNGYSVQYASSSGTSYAVTSLPNASLAPGQYFLVQLACNVANGVPLPTPDATGTSNMSASNGKVALVSNSTAITGSGDPDVVDFVGYGSANDSETSPAPNGNNLNSLHRAGMGCTDTDDNSADFSTSAPTPRNTASPTHSCATTPDLSVGKLGPVTAKTGGTIVYTLTATAGTVGNVNGVLITDSLPVDVTFVGSSPVQTSGPNPLAWNLGTINAGTTQTIVVTVTVNSSANTNITNIVTGTTTTTGDNPNNNSATVVTNISNDQSCGTGNHGNPAEGPGFCAAPFNNDEFRLFGQGFGSGDTQACFFIDVNANEQFYINFHPTSGVADFTVTPYENNIAGSPITTGDPGTSEQEYGPVNVPATGVDAYQVCFTNGEVGDLWIEFTNPAGATGRIHSSDWDFTHKSYCPNCRFEFAVVAQCGETLRLPLDDFEQMTGLEILAPDGTPALYKVVRTRGATACTYYEHNGSTGVYDPTLCEIVTTGGLPVGSGSNGTYNDDFSSLPFPPNPDLDTVAFYDPDAVDLDDPLLYGAACYSASDGSVGDCAGGAQCEDESPGDSNQHNQAEMYIEIDVSQTGNGCGIYNLSAPAATGFNWDLGGSCYDGDTELGAYEIYFNGAATCGGSGPNINVTPLPEIYITSTVLLEGLAPVDPVNDCSAGTIEVPLLIDYVIENGSCGDASDFDVQFELTDLTGTSYFTDTIVGGLGAYSQDGQQLIASAQCSCGDGVITGGSVQLTQITPDSSEQVVECSEDTTTNCTPATTPTTSSVFNCLTLYQPTAIELSFTHNQATTQSLWRNGLFMASFMLLALTGLVWHVNKRTKTENSGLG